MRTPVILLLLAAAAPLSGCTSMLLGNGTSAGRPISTDTRSSSQPSDRQISAIILDRYAADADLSGHGLRVNTRGGVVTLSGTLDSYEKRDRAARIARDVQGVERVNIQIGIDR